MICALSPSALLYEDMCEFPRVIRLFEFDDSQPNQAGKRNVIHPQLDGEIADMCTVQDGYKQLLIVAARDVISPCVSRDGTFDFYGQDGIFAYNTATDKREWAFCGKLPGMENIMKARGVATDGRGHLFVSDQGNHCIHLFSVDGNYIKCLLKGEDRLGNPGIIRWWVEESCLVTVCGRESHLKVISVLF